MEGGWSVRLKVSENVTEKLIGLECAETGICWDVRLKPDKRARHLLLEQSVRRQTPQSVDNETKGPVGPS